MPVPEGVSKEKFDRCVDEVKEKKDESSAFAICNSSMSKKKKEKVKISRNGQWSISRE